MAQGDSFVTVILAFIAFTATLCWPLLNEINRRRIIYVPMLAQLNEFENEVDRYVQDKKKYIDGKSRKVEPFRFQEGLFLKNIAYTSIGDQEFQEAVVSLLNETPVFYNHRCCTIPSNDDDEEMKDFLEIVEDLRNRIREVKQGLNDMKARSDNYIIGLTVALFLLVIGFTYMALKAYPYPLPIQNVPGISPTVFPNETVQNTTNITSTNIPVTNISL